MGRSSVYMLRGHAQAAGCVRLSTPGAMEFRVTSCLKNDMPGSKMSTCARHTLSFSSLVPRCTAGGSGLAWRELALQAWPSTAAGGGRWCGPAAHPAHLSWALHRPGRLRVPEPQQPRRAVHAEVCVRPGRSGAPGCHGSAGAWGSPPRDLRRNWWLRCRWLPRSTGSFTMKWVSDLVAQWRPHAWHRWCPAQYSCCCVSYWSCDVPLAVRDSC